MKLIQGDCLEKMKNIKDKSIDMILCDLPYGTTSNKWDEIIPFEPLWEQYERIIKDNGAIVLTAQAPFDKKLGYSNLKLFRYEWIWVKSNSTGFLNAKKMPLKNHENILVFYKKLPYYDPQGIVKLDNPIPRKGSKKTSSNYDNHDKGSIQEFTGYPKTVLHFKRDKYNFHPTQKPTSLLEYLIKTYTKEGGTVLDNCMGSGSTGIACLNTNREFIGIERDEKYFNVAKKRITEHEKVVSKGNVKQC